MSQNRKRNGSQRAKRGCRYYLVSGCLLLVIISVLSAVPFTIFLETMVVPNVEASQLENLPPAMRAATLYIKDMDRPIPHDVILTESLKAKARARGYEDYQLQAVIAAADQTGVLRKDLLAIMDMEGGWPSDIKANTYMIALQKAMGLISLGYEKNDKVLIQKAVFEYFGQNQIFVDVFLEQRNSWKGASAAKIRRLPIWVWRAWPGIVAQFWTYYNLGYGDLATMFGSGGSFPGLPGGVIPDVPDGTFVNPYPGSGICGYSYATPVGSHYHWGIDMCKGGQDWVVAGHNCIVSWVGDIPRVSQRAVDWWVSGETVACESSLSDGTTIWTVYGHGEPGTYQVRVGDSVRAGEVLMLADSTGFSSGNHLHYGMRINGSWVNPALTLP